MHSCHLHWLRVQLGCPALLDHLVRPCGLLRCLQDVLVVTAPGSGAEIIPFLKTWVNLPMAIGFTVLYAKVSGGLSLTGAAAAAPIAATAQHSSNCRCKPFDWP